MGEGRCREVNYQNSDVQWGNWRCSGLGTDCGREALEAVRICAKEPGCLRSSEMRDDVPM